MESSEVKKYYTYQLVDPRNGVPFYVGKGCGNRMYKHVYDVERGKIPNKTNFDLFTKISSILEENFDVNHEKLSENINELEALALESAFIDFYGLDNLCNYIKSWCGRSERSEETRRRQSIAHKGEKSYMFGVPKTEEQKEKNRIAHTGKNNVRYDHTIYDFYNHKLGLREKCTQCELRKKYNISSPDIHRLITKKRYSVSGWSLGMTPEEIEMERRKKVSLSNKGKPKSEEHRRNLWLNRPKRKEISCKL